MRLSILLKFILPSGFLATAAVTILYLIVAKIGSNVSEGQGGVGASSSTVTTVCCKYLVVVWLLFDLVYQILKVNSKFINSLL